MTIRAEQALDYFNHKINNMTTFQGPTFKTKVTCMGYNKASGGEPVYFAREDEEMILMSCELWPTGRSPFRMHGSIIFFDNEDVTLVEGNLGKQVG